MKRRILSIVTALALCLGLCPTWAFAVEGETDTANAPMLADVASGDVTISSQNGQIITFTAEQCVGSCQGHTITQTVSGGVAQNTTILVESGNHNITFSGLNLRFAKVGVMPGATMNLTLDGTNSISASASMAGIYVPVGATLVITEQSTGSLNVSGNDGGTGIGGSYYVADPTNSDGDNQQGDLNCGTVIINGGIITANGSSMGAGIGGASSGSGYGNGGTVTINGGNITATGGSEEYWSGAGIGGGSYNSKSGYGGTLTINGGHVMLNVGAHDTAEGNAYGFGQGSATSRPSGPCELILADENYLTLADGTTLDPNGTYSLNGDPTADMITVPTGLLYNGQDQTEAAKAAISLVSTGNETKEFLGRTFRLNADTADWDYTIAPEVVQEAGDYTVTYAKDNKTPLTKTFTVAACPHTNLVYQPLEGGKHGGACPDCHEEVAEDHVWADGACSVCHTQAVARVEKASGESVYVTCLADAFTSEHNGATVTLLGNVTEKNIIIDEYESTVFVLDLAGYTINGDITVLAYAELTIRDSSSGKTGSVISNNNDPTLLVNYGNLILEGGNIVSGKTEGIEIENGSLSVISDDVKVSAQKSALKISGWLKIPSISLSAGTYTGNPAIQIAENADTTWEKMLLNNGIFP